MTLTEAIRTKVNSLAQSAICFAEFNTLTDSWKTLIFHCLS